jgi:hypothetical protein
MFRILEHVLARRAARPPDPARLTTETAAKRDGDPRLRLAAVTEPDLHPALEPLAFLVGHWSGASEGLWVPGEPIVFRDEIEFGHVGKPYLIYLQRTWLEDGTPSHGEAGYLSAAGDGELTLTVAEPSGIVEVHAGTVAGTTLELRLVALGRGPSAKPVTGVERRLSVDGDVLEYSVRIAMNGEEPADHIRGTLRLTQR